MATIPHKPFAPLADGLSLKQSFNLFNYLLTGLGLTALTLSEILPGPANVMFLVCLGLCFVMESNQVIPFLPPSGTSFSKWFILGALFLVLALNNPLLESVVLFLVILMFSRIIVKTELNDYLYGYLIAIICLLLGAIYIRSFVFSVIFLGFYLVLGWCLILYNLLAERLGSSASPDQMRASLSNEFVKPSLFGVSAVMIAGSLILTVLIFVSFPRLGLGFLTLNTSNSPLTGFSDKVRLGDVGLIKQNEQVVMRIQFKRNGKAFRPDRRILWRGVALDHYNGRQWTSTVSPKWQVRNQPGVGVSLFRVESPVDIIEQEIFMEAFDSEYIFTNGIPLELDGNFKLLRIDQSFSMRVSDSRFGPKKLRMISEIGHPTISYDRIGPVIEDPRFLTRFLQLPGTLSPRIHLLARQLTQHTEEPETKARKVLNHFSDGYEYSLEMVKEQGKSSLENFLFFRRKGHCEYFASAMTVLLRSAGIPTRVVNGFVGVEWNDVGQYMIVRQSHAHSWVEAFLPGKGWTIFDPTPPDPAFSPANAPGSWARTMDYLRLNWQRYVVRYSFRDQVDLMNWLSQGGQSFALSFKPPKNFNWENTFEYLKRNGRLLTFIALALLITVLMRWKRLREFGWTRKPPAVTLYRELLRKLSRRGIHKQPHWTPRELLDHLEGLNNEQKANVKNLTLHYEKTRFGALPLPPDELKTLRGQLKTL